MNKNLIYIGVGAVALIGIYMYVKNRGASNNAQTSTSEGKSIGGENTGETSESTEQTETPTKPTTRDIRNIKLRTNRSIKPSSTSTNISS